MKLLVCILVNLMLITNYTYAQSTYIGLKAETNREGIVDLSLERNSFYWPLIQIIDNHIYMPTKNGIYKKSISSINDTLWNMYAFEGLHICDFVKNNNELIAITNKRGDSLMVYSNDDGQTTIFRNSSYFQAFDSLNSIFKLAHNSTNFNKVLVSHYYGISVSTDKGISWSTLSDYTPSYQYRFIDFNPLDSNSLFSTGENGFFSSYVYRSIDGGNSWADVDSEPNNCTHFIAFHPQNKNTLILGGEGRIARSIDNGTTWTPTNINNPYLYIYKIIYDKTDFNTLYASGVINGATNTIYFLKSIDGGSSWDYIYKEKLGLGNVSGLLDFEIHNNKIIFSTVSQGLYVVDLSVVNSLEENNFEEGVILYPNPNRGSVFIKSDNNINQIRVYNSLGQLLKSIMVDAKSTTIKLDELSQGLYVFKINIENKYYNKTIIKL